MLQNKQKFGGFFVYQLLYQYYFNKIGRLAAALRPNNFRDDVVIAGIHVPIEGIHYHFNTC